jgi:hypothetical protein
MTRQRVLLKASPRVLFKTSRRPMVISTLKIEVEREDDGRWLAEVVELPGVLVLCHVHKLGLR